MTAAPATTSPGKVATFLDLIKFAHSVFALPWALIATALAFRVAAGGWDRWWERLLLILVCMVAARTYAMTVNRLVDRRFDKLNPRTARRPSVTGAISPGFMMVVIALCVAVFFAGAAGFWWRFANPWPTILAAPVLAWLGFYSFTKRFTALCHFVLGISLGLAPVSAWIAIAPPAGSLFNPAIVLMGVAVTFWVAGFDILYAMQDEQIDRAAQLNSIPARFGRGGALWISRLSHALTLAALAGAGLAAGLGPLYWIAVAVAAALLIVEQSLVKLSDISKINIAFMTVNGVIGLVVGGLAIADILLLHR
jgi:4-hydroxybenzoate polyprenyltransferase